MILLIIFPVFCELYESFFVYVALVFEKLSISYKMLYTL